MNIKLLAVIGPTLARPGGLSDTGRERLSESLNAYSAKLLRVWETPVQVTEQRSALLVVRDPPELSVTARLLAGEQLRLEGAISLDPLGTGDDLASDLDAISKRLPEQFPGVVIQRGLILPSPEREAILGLAMCPECGGWGTHIDPDCSRA